MNDMGREVEPIRSVRPSFPDGEFVCRWRPRPAPAPFPWVRVLLVVGAAVVYAAVAMAVR